MQVSIKKIGAIERKLTISVPHASVIKEIEERLHKAAKSTRIPGFRPGKAPQNLIKQRYGEKIANEVISDTIQSSYREALKQENIIPAGLLSIVPEPFVPGNDLQYIATIELYPEILAPTLAGKTIEKLFCKIAAEDIDQTVENIRKNHAEFINKTSPAEPGDRLTIDFVGTMEGNSFAGGTKENQQFVIGDGHILESFEADLLGVQAGQAKQISFTFPADYASEEVAGKAVVFAVTVKTVEQRILPDVDDALAEKLGLKEGGIKKMREEVENNLNRELEMRMRTVMHHRVMNELLKANPIDVPQTLVGAEIDRIMQSIEKQQPNTKQNLDRDKFSDQARHSVTLGLVMRGVIEKANTTVTAAEVRARIEKMAASYTDSKNFIDLYYADRSRLQTIEAMLLEEKAIEHVLETAKLTEKEISFEAFNVYWQQAESAPF